MPTISVDVDLEDFDNDDLISALESRKLSNSEIDDLAAIVEDHRALYIDADADSIKPNNLWHSQIFEEVNSLLTKMNPLQLLEALQNLSK